MTEEVKQPLKIYILCGDASYNRGDRVNLTSQLKLLMDSFPGCEIFFDSYRAEVDSTWYPATVMRRGFLGVPKKIAALRNADLIVWGGGALMADNASRVLIPYWFVIIGFVKHILRKPVMAWAHGVVITTPFGAKCAARIYSWIDLVAVRDNNSLQQLAKLDIPKDKLVKTADPAVLASGGTRDDGARLLEREGIRTDGRKLFAIAATFCSYHYEPGDIIPYMIAKQLGLRKDRGRAKIERLVTALARIADGIVRDHDADVVFLPTYPAPWENDLEHFRAIVAQAQSSDRMHIIQQDCYTPDQYVALWHHLAFVLAIPMHHNIISTAMNVPCLNLYYEKKGKDFFIALEAEDRLLSVDCLFEQDCDKVVGERIRYTLQNWESIQQAYLPHFETLKSQARENAILLKERVLQDRF